MSNIKQAPFLGLTGMGGGGTGLALGGAVAKKTYIDDVLSTYLYRGTNGANTVTTGLDMSGEGGLTWIKARSSNGTDHTLFDTVRGVNKKLRTDTNEAESTFSWNQTFTSTGFTLNTPATDLNDHNVDYTSWNFRRAKGFFDVVTYNGDNGAPGFGTSDIPHNLGCIPGLIILKRTDTTGTWWVYHRDLPTTSNAAWSKVLQLNVDNGQADSYNLGSAAYHTSTTFRVGNDNQSNQTGGTYVAYLFAGGESIAATARSVEFNGSSDYLTLASTSDVAFGTGDYTVEAWVKTDNISSAQYLVSLGDGDDFSCGITNSEWFYYNHSSSTKSGGTPVAGQWTHFAVARSSGTSKLFINGIEKNSWSDSRNFSSSAIAIGRHKSNAGYYWDGHISNLRIVKGTAVYTSSFRPPTEPLTNITNTKLLCCNNSSTTGSTVTPGTITANSSPTASTDSPFDDPDAFIFGEEGDQSIIKTGMWEGTGTAGLEINVGWQPSWILFKNASSSGYNWYILDVMRGVTRASNFIIKPNSNEKEFESSYLEVTPTGFRIETTHALGNNNGSSYVYMAIRFPDGYVGKPAKVGTDVFAIDTGDGDSSIPNFDSGFPVAFALQRPNGMGYTGAFARLLGHNVLYTATNGAQQAESDGQSEFDSNLGWGASSSFQISTTQSYMWKRSAGFGVITYQGDAQIGRVVFHNLARSPEMIWIKKRDASEPWAVGHKGLNGGTNPWEYYLQLESNIAEADYPLFNDQAPSSTSFHIHSNDMVNGENHPYIAMLFASVSGISRVGYYNGSGSTGNAQSIGFQPRYLIIKRINSTGNWMQFNSLSGFDKYTQLDTNQQQYSQTYVNVSATGFSLVSDYGDTNESGSKYIYYAHA